jgi:Uma2 family endonuclease
MNLIAQELPIPAPEHVDQRVTLHRLGWQDYERLLDMRGENGGTRITYSDGELELMTPSIDHESYKKRLARLLEAYAEERDIDLEGYGSWTLKQQPKQTGLEPDECYVIGQTEPPPMVPDIAIEVIWTSGGIDKLDLYRRLEVPEAWFWEHGQLQFFILETEGYEQCPGSKLLPGLDPQLLGRFMHGMSQSQAVRAYRRALRKSSTYRQLKRKEIL